MKYLGKSEQGVHPLRVRALIFLSQLRTKIQNTGEKLVDLDNFRALYLDNEAQTELTHNVKNMFKMYYRRRNVQGGELCRRRNVLGTKCAATKCERRNVRDELM